jgi:flagellar basal body-associated protein FliL
LERSVFSCGWYKSSSIIIIIIIILIIIIIIIIIITTTTTEGSYIVHSTHTSESANVEAQKSLISKTALYAPLTLRTE